MEWAQVSFKELSYLSQFERQEFEPHSSVVNLIQGIYELNPAHAREILRNRIFTSHPLSEMCLGMIQVAAKRHSVASALPEFSNVSSISEPNPSKNHFEISLPLGRKVPQQFSDWKQAARNMMSEIALASNEQDQPKYLRNRPVIAFLFNANNELLGWSKNTNSLNRTLHAEVNLVQGWWNKQRKGIPAGAKILTTLQSCKMCAGMIWSCAEAPDELEVFYLDQDPGPNARNRVWDRLGPHVERQML